MDSKFEKGGKEEFHSLALLIFNALPEVRIFVEEGIQRIYFLHSFLTSSRRSSSGSFFELLVPSPSRCSNPSCNLTSQTRA